MKNQPYRLGLKSLGFKSIVVFTFLLSSMQGCAGDASSNSKAAPNNDTVNQTEVTKNVFKVLTKADPVFFIDGKQNPELTLKRGVTYIFELKTTGHPFWIKTKNSTGKINAYEAGVTGNGTERGTLTFAVPTDAPALLHYNCEVHDMMNGAIHITD